jgi:RimJ/RimL family protein N-acetyltransferase
MEARQPVLGFIGTMTAYVDTHNEVAEVGIMIGERSAWGQGYGLEAWQAVCDYLLAQRNIRKITAGTAATNTAMRRIMEKAGMVPDGLRKAQYIIDNKSVDVIHMALFKSLMTKS